MEGTLTTPYFFREGRWITPAEGCGGNRGTTRRWALDAGLCEEGVLRRESVREGEVVWLSNGVRGFGWGIVELEGWEVRDAEKAVRVKEETDMAERAGAETTGDAKSRNPLNKGE